MLEAKRSLTAKKDCSRVIVAGEQSQGRGRYGRIWFSPKGNLYLTCIQQTERPIEQIPIIVGVAVAQILKRFINRSLTIKPPNDILVDGKKICGILIEEYDPFFSIGIGINVASSPLIQFYETTFVHEYNKHISVGFLLRCFFKHYNALLKKDFEDIQAIYNTLCHK